MIHGNKGKPMPLLRFLTVVAAAATLWGCQDLRQAIGWTSPPRSTRR